MASPLYFAMKVACETIRYCLQNGAFCEESASAFVIIAGFHITVGQPFDQAHHWASIAKNIVEKSKADYIVLRAGIKLYGFVWFWFIPLQESADLLQELYETSLRLGEMESAYLAFSLGLRFSIFRGERLSILSQSIGKQLQSMVSTSGICCCPFFAIKILMRILLFLLFGRLSSVWAVPA